MIELDDADRAILRDCPFDISSTEPRMGRVKRLWSAGFVSGTVLTKWVMNVTLRDPGRLAIGRPAIETPAEGSV